MYRIFQIHVFIVKHIHLFFANKYYSTKYEALNEKFRNLLFNSCKFELKHSTQPQINDCSNRQILRLTRRCYFERLKWKSKFVMKKEFFSTFALHYLNQGSIRTAKSNFLILHHLQFLMKAGMKWKEYKSNFMKLQFFSFQKLFIAFDQKNMIL